MKEVTFMLSLRKPNLHIGGKKCYNAFLWIRISRKVKKQNNEEAKNVTAGAQSRGRYKEG